MGRGSREGGTSARNYWEDYWQKDWVRAGAKRGEDGNTVNPHGGVLLEASNLCGQKGGSVLPMLEIYRSIFSPCPQFRGAIEYWLITSSYVPLRRWQPDGSFHGFTQVPRN